MGDPFWSYGGTPEHTHHVPLPIAVGVVGQRNQLNNTELSRQDSKLRERGSERDRKQKVPGRVERPVPRSGLDGYRKLCCGGSTAAGPSIWLIQTDDKRQTTDDYDKHWEPLFRVRFGGVPAHDRLASGVCRTLGPRLEVQTDIQTDERNTLYQTQFYLQPAHHWVPQASLLGAPGFPESPLRINVYVNISNMSVLLCFN